jgi:hypothetical protein
MLEAQIGGVLVDLVVELLRDGFDPLACSRLTMGPRGRETVGWSRCSRRCRTKWACPAFPLTPRRALRHSERDLSA